MKEAKSPKKPLIFYYGVVLAVLLAFNMIVSPLLLERQVTEVDYGTFMRMIDDKDIGEVQMDDSEILFSNKAGDAVYKTVALQDSTLAAAPVRGGRQVLRHGGKNHVPPAEPAAYRRAAAAGFRGAGPVPQPQAH